MTPKSTPQSPEAVVPLRPMVFDILLLLNQDERHGYGLMRDLRDQKAGRPTLGPGTLYRTLKEMQERGMIEPATRRPAPDQDDERRRYYRLTAFGRRVAAAEAARMSSLVRIAQQGALLSDPESTS